MAKKHNTRELNAVFQALANGTRRKILTRLAREGSRSISELAQPFDMSLAAVSKHIRTLEKAGLVIKQRDNTTFYCFLNPEPVRSAGALIHYFEQFLINQEAGVSASAAGRAAQVPVQEASRSESYASSEDASETSSENAETTEAPVKEYIRF